MPEQPQLTIVVPTEELPGLQSELEARGVRPGEPIEGHGFDGSAAGLIVIPLIPSIVKALVELYSRRQETKRHISYQYKGLKVSSVSEATLLRIIELHQKTSE